MRPPVDATDPANLAEGVEPLGALESPVKVELPPDNIGPLELRQAAANGDARAQFEVAAIYTEGRAVPEDLKTAAVWYERSASQGFAPAQYRLGNLYENRQGRRQGPDAGPLWYQQRRRSG
jgi:localization factor PodJL